MSRWRDDLALVRERTFAFLLLIRTISVLGSAFAPVALAFGVLHIPGGSAEELSVVLTCESVPLVVFLLVGGVVADRYRRNRVMMVGELLSMTAFAAIAAMMLGGWTPLWALGTAAALSGIGIAIVWPALSGIIPQLVAPEHLQQGNALLALCVNIARIVGIVSSGAVVAWVGGAWALLVSAAMFAVAALLVSQLAVGAPSRDEASATSVLGDLRAGWSEFVRHEWLWVVVAQWSLLVLCFEAAHGVLGPVLADQELGGARAWSFVLAGEAVGMVVGVLVAMRWRPRRPILVSVLVTVPTIPTPYVLLGVGAPLPLVVLAAFGMGVAFDIFGVMWNTTMQRVVPPEALSRVSSYDALGSLMLGPVGLMLAGPAAARFGVHRALVGCGVLLLVVAASSLVSRDVRTLRAPAEEGR